MNCIPRHPCCKETLNLYRQLQMALMVATDKKRDRGNRVLSIMDVLKNVVLQDDNDTASMCSDTSVQSDIMATDSASNNHNNCQYETDNPNAPFILGLSAAVMYLEDPSYNEVATKTTMPPTIIGLPATGLNSPVVPGRVGDLMIIQARTTNALHCLRQHILPDYHLKTEC